MLLTMVELTMAGVALVAELYSLIQKPAARKKNHNLT